VIGPPILNTGGWPRFNDLDFIDTKVAESISLQQFPWKYRETEGAPGSGVWYLGLGVILFFALWQSSPPSETHSYEVGLSGTGWVAMKSEINLFS
jgi:hypothetical protein